MSELMWKVHMDEKERMHKEDTKDWDLTLRPKHPAQTGERICWSCGSEEITLELEVEHRLWEPPHPQAGKKTALFCTQVRTVPLPRGQPPGETAVG